jgi:hypothetical protein
VVGGGGDLYLRAGGTLVQHVATALSDDTWSVGFINIERGTATARVEVTAICVTAQ